jgi:hypothetical protein
MELVLVELDAIAELDSTEYSEAAGAELVGGTNLNSGRGRRMERDRDGRCVGRGGADERRRQSPSRERGRRRRAESVPRWQAER